MLLITAFVSSVCFRVFDSDGDGFLSRSDIELMCKALIEIRKENVGEKVRQAVIIQPSSTFIILFLSTHQGLLTLLFLAVCRTFVTYEPSLRLMSW